MENLYILQNLFEVKFSTDCCFDNRPSTIIQTKKSTLETALNIPHYL